MDLAFNNQQDARRDTLSLSPCIHIETKDFSPRLMKENNSDLLLYSWCFLPSHKCSEVWKGGRVVCQRGGGRHKKICKVTPKQVSRIIFKSRNAEQKQKILFWTDNTDKKQALKMSQFLIPEPFGGQLFCQWRSFRKSRSYLSQLN